MEFKPINTQEEFDEAIQKRLKREQEKHEAEVKRALEKYSDYETLKQKAADYDALATKDYETQVSNLTKQLEETNGKLAEKETSVASLTERAKKAETELLKSRIANEFKIPYSLADRLAGSTEEELRKDAESFSQFLAGTVSTPDTMAATEPEGNSAGSDFAAYQALYNGLNLNN